MSPTLRPHGDPSALGLVCELASGGFVALDPRLVANRCASPPAPRRAPSSENERNPTVAAASC